MTDCNKIQTNNLACNKISLTDKWKKGELPIGWYWVEGSRAEGIYAYTAEYLNNMYRPRNSERIIEKVPSYEEYQQLKEELKDYEYQHKQDGICYDDIFCKLELARKEQQKLTSDCHTLAQKLLQVKPELREWLEVNFKEYL